MSSLSVIKSHLDNGHGKGEIELCLALRSSEGRVDPGNEMGPAKGGKTISENQLHLRGRKTSFSLDVIQ